MKKISIEKLIKIINVNLEGYTITNKQREMDLEKLGLNSISFIRMIIQIEDEFEYKFPDSKLLLSEANTINKILDILQHDYSSENLK